MGGRLQPEPTSRLRSATSDARLMENVEDHTVRPLLRSSQPDPQVLQRLASVQYVCLALAALIAVGVLSGWLISPIGRVLPAEWSLMKANTALALLLSVLSLTLSLPRRSSRLLRVSQLLAVAVALMGLTVLLEYAFHFSVAMDIFPIASGAPLQPARMAPQSAAALLLLGSVMTLIRMRKRLAGQIADLLVFSLCLFVLVMASGYVFGAMHLFGLSIAIRAAPQTVICLMLLSFVAFSRRAEYGVFSVLVGVGIAGQTARMICPFALILPFGMTVVRAVAIQAGIISTQYASAVATSLVATLAFIMVLILGRRIDGMEIDLRDLSLRDELTGVYNRRGFYVLAEQAFRLAHRSGLPLSLLFIDLDNLKQINDTLGHEAGSMFLREIGDLLRANFRESDVVGRIGGDEFVVAGVASEAGIDLATRHLEQATARQNSLPDRRYVLSFSLGRVTSDPANSEPLEDLLARADRAMYLAKQRRKLTQGDEESESRRLLVAEGDVPGPATT
jgi:diguanylate cyclase (GGDEF)-like protein